MFSFVLRTPIRRLRFFLQKKTEVNRLFNYPQKGCGVYTAIALRSAIFFISCLTDRYIQSC